MLRFLLGVIVIFLLLRAIMRFFAGRFLRQQWPFGSFDPGSGKAASSSGVTEEADFEVIETNVNKNESRTV